MSRKSNLGAWLAGLDAGALLEVLRHRPDATVHPEPRDLQQLSSRLSVPHSVQRALEGLSLPALQAGTALLALGGTARPDALRRLLGADDAAGAAAVDRAVAELTRHALAWPTPQGLRINSAWRQLDPFPLHLGHPAAELLEQLTVARLERIGSALGLTGARRKGDWVRDIAGALADADAVRARLARARPDVADAVRRIAEDGPLVDGLGFGDRLSSGAAESLAQQLVVGGWVVAPEWVDVGEMPREVALAVRGPGHHAPFHPEPPALATAPVEAAALDAAGRHAAGATLAGVRGLLGQLERSPLQRLQAGGVGVRELRRAAKALRTDEATVRLWLESAAEAGLVAAAADGVLVTAEAEEWAAAEPAAALARLLTAWWRLDIVPTHRVDETGKAEPAVLQSWYSDGRARWVRADVLEALAALSPPGERRGLADPSALADALVHRRPLAFGSPEAMADVAATLAEAEHLGLVADHALTPLGSDVLAATGTSNPAAALAVALADVLPAPTRTATFLPDLTAVVTGPPAAALTRVLDEAADAETRDTASTWRFGPASVRRALDAGRTADELLAALAEVADNPLPQPLEYLVRDVARQHGRIQVFAVACCVRVADPALGAEIAAHKALEPLRLRVLADTVLASSKPIGETVAALRAAGYAPVRQDGSGATVVERAPVRRAENPRRRTGTVPLRGHPDLPALARRLARAAPDAHEPDLLNLPLLPDEVPMLSEGEAAVLGHAITTGTPVLIDYVNAAGNPSTRVIEPSLKLGPTLVAYCRMRQAERNFALARIVAVGPAPG